MTWSDFYLLCFAVGFAFSVLSFLLSGLHWHLPVGHHGGHVHVGGDAHGTAHHHGPQASVLNPPTIAAFLAWFGGTGYLLTRYSGIALAGGLLISVLVGMVGATVVFLFLSRVLMSEDEHLNPADFEMVGVLGRLSLPIRVAGTGELIYSQMGTRRTCGARSDEGVAIEKGVEVVVTRYEKGIAYVRKWEDMAGEKDAAAEI